MAVVAGTDSSAAALGVAYCSSEVVVAAQMLEEEAAKSWVVGAEQEVGAGNRAVEVASSVAGAVELQEPSSRSHPVHLQQQRREPGARVEEEAGSIHRLVVVEGRALRPIEKALEVQDPHLVAAGDWA